MRHWLTKNKIYFEVFSYFFLGLASIFVSFLSWKTSDRQLEISEKEHSPLISLQRDYKGPFELINVINVGYHAFETNVDVQSYYEIEKNDYAKKTKTMDLMRVDDFYDFVSTTENTSGRLATIYSNENYDKETKRITTEFYKHPNYLNYELSLNSIVKVTFNDENQNELSKYFLINSFTISEIKKDRFLDIYNKLQECYFNNHNKHLKDIIINDLIE